MKLLKLVIFAFFIAACNNPSPAEMKAREELKRVYNGDAGDVEKVIILDNMIKILEKKKNSISENERKEMYELMKMKSDLEAKMEQVTSDRKRRIEELDREAEELKKKLQK